MAAGNVEPGVLMRVAHAFAQAELNPGTPLQGAMVDAMEAQAATISAEVGPEDIARHFGDLAEALNNDPFAIHAELAAVGAAFPPEHRAAMANAFAVSDTAALREAALGFAFAPDPVTSSATLAALARPPRGQPISILTVERMVRMRPWVSDARRPHVDAAIRASRPKASPPLPVAPPEVRRVLASLCDGAGAQSLFVLAKHGRTFALAVLAAIEFGELSWLLRCMIVSPARYPAGGRRIGLDGGRI